MKYTCCPADWTKLSNTRKSTSKYWVKESGTIRIQNNPEEEEPMQQQRSKMKPFWLLNETGPNPSLANAGIICWKLILANKQPLVQCPQSNINIGRNILRRSAHRRPLSSLPRLGWRGHTWPNTGKVIRSPTICCRIPLSPRPMLSLGSWTDLQLFVWVRSRKPWAAPPSCLLRLGVIRF